MTPVSRRLTVIVLLPVLLSAACGFVFGTVERGPASPPTAADASVVTPQPPPEPRGAPVPAPVAPAPATDPVGPPESRTAPAIPVPPAPPVVAAREPSVVAPAGDASLTPERILAIARIAWRYFEHHRQPATGLIDSVHRYPHTTMWDTASGIAAYVAAERLGILTRERFAREMRQLLRTLATLPLYRGELPNREYHTASGHMDDLRTGQRNHGSGWSALDVARLAVWLHILRTWHPDLREDVERVVARWQLTRLVRNAELHGTLHDGRREALRQEGRLGYEQYAAQGLRPWNVEAAGARDYDFVREADLLGVAISHDTRGYAFLASEPFYMMAMEMGMPEARFAAITDALYEATKRRSRQSGRLIAVTEDARDRAPWFAYNTLFMDGEPWKCVSPTARPLAPCQSFSTKAAVAWYAIRPDAYSLRLLERAETLADPVLGFHAGLYDDGTENRSLNVNTNGVVLEAMLFLHNGRRPFVEVR